MEKLTIIFWSGTGNTETMAMAINAAAQAKGYQSILKNVASATLADVEQSDYLAFGCPAMGAEELEDEMENFMNKMASSELIKNKKTVLFGSYDWGDGEWMTEWEKRITTLGLNLVTPGLIINEKPDDEGIEKCRNLINAFEK